jgi:fatty acid desaturase
MLNARNRGQIVRHCGYRQLQEQQRHRERHWPAGTVYEAGGYGEMAYDALEDAQSNGLHEITREQRKRAGEQKTQQRL